MDNIQKNKTEQETDAPCHGVYDCMMQATKEDRISQFERLFRRIHAGFSNMLIRIKRDGFIGMIKFRIQKKCGYKSKNKHGEISMDEIQEILNLKPGDWVEVKPEQEILRLLDKHKRFKGLRFMSGMEKCCGRRYKVYKRLERMLMESTGEYRKIKNSVLLEGAMCDGEPFNGCDRSCFFYWREAWLKKVDGPK